jgi:hypothetical protein
MKAKNFVTVVSVVAFVLILPFSSCNFLDVDDFFNETIKYDSIFSNKYYLERYLWTTALEFPDEGGIFGNCEYTPGIMATDEAFGLGGAYERSIRFVNGELSSSNIAGISVYNQMYRVIRTINIILARMHECEELTKSEENELRAYAHFMRGYAYYHLVMMYGPVVLLYDEVLNTNEQLDYYARYRATYDECIEYICEEFEQAARHLPIDVPIQFLGRPTRGAALGLIARLRLQHASPLFNGGTRTFANFVRSSDKKHYFQQQYDEHRWALAAMKAKRIIDLDMYQLFTVPRKKDLTPDLKPGAPAADFPLGFGNIDTYCSYKDLFSGEAIVARNPEYLWVRYSDQVTDFIQRSFPQELLAGFNNLSVTQKIVDHFYMDDGRTIEEAKADGYYSEIGYRSVTLNDQYYDPNFRGTFSGYTLCSPASSGTGTDAYQYRVHNMYVNREMRFYANVAFDGSFWDCLTSQLPAAQRKHISYQRDGIGGIGNTGNDQNSYPITGYILKKYVHPDDCMSPRGLNGRVLPKSFPIIRYAEILLSYVEALNNLEQSYTLTDELTGDSYVIERDEALMAYYFNQVRFRVGLPGLKPEELASVEKMNEIIKRERMIEFMAENRRFYDVRRWGDYEESEKNTLMGMNAEEVGDAYYERVPLNHSKARNRRGSDDPKLIFVPLPLNEIRRAPTLDQNQGW